MASNLVGGDSNGNYDVFSTDNPLFPNLPINAPVVTSFSGRSFEIDPQYAGAGQLVQGTNNAFDGLNRLQVGTTFYATTLAPTYANGNRTVITSSVDMGGIGVHRAITVPATGTQDFARTIEVLHNLTSSPITQSFRLVGNLGSDAGTTVFATSDGDLVVEPTDGDNNGTFDIYVKDNLTGSVTLASVNNITGAIGDGPSYNPILSADGRYVAFWSFATNLVPNDTNSNFDSFVKDLQTGAITRVSTRSDGSQGNSESDTPVISADGRYVAFYSAASNLVAGDINGALDIFLKDTQTGITTLVSAGTTSSPRIFKRVNCEESQPTASASKGISPATNRCSAPMANRLSIMDLLQTSFRVTLTEYTMHFKLAIHSSALRIP